MIKYVLYANVNPLEPNTLVKVADSNNFTMSLSECKERFEKLGYELLSKNFTVSLKRIEESTLKDWIPMEEKKGGLRIWKNIIVKA